MIIRAYAKINWFLHIIGKRKNGYHELEMIMQHINLFDELNIKILSGCDIILEILNSEILAADENNLIIKAANLLLSSGNVHSGLHIKLNKNIPMGAGLGGGSADAAATMHALNQLLNLNYPLEKLQEIGLKIGADVPYCLEEGPAIVCGIGENIIKVNFPEEHWLVLLKPKESLSTSKIFSLYSSMDGSKIFDLQGSISAIKNNDISGLNILCGNSLEVPAIIMLPEIEILKRTLKENGALFSQMSGSGSSVFGIFKSRDAAKRAWLSLKKTHTTCILTKTLIKATAVLSKQ